MMRRRMEEEDDDDGGHDVWLYSEREDVCH